MPFWYLMIQNNVNQEDKDDFITAGIQNETPTGWHSLYKRARLNQLFFSLVYHFTSSEQAQVQRRRQSFWFCFYTVVNLWLEWWAAWCCYRVWCLQHCASSTDLIIWNPQIRNILIKLSPYFQWTPPINLQNKYYKCSNVSDSLPAVFWLYHKINHKTECNSWKTKLFRCIKTF